MASLPATRRFTVQEYYRMAAAGILSEDDRVELIEGEIVELPPIGSRHAATVRRLNWLFGGRVGERALVVVHSPVRLGERSEPQPDLALVLPRADFYVGGHPGPAAVLLLVEVGDSSIGYDRAVKVPLYAGAGIRELWLVDLEAERVEVLREPAGRGYRIARTYRRGDRVGVEALLGIELAVADILGE